MHTKVGAYKAEFSTYFFLFLLWSTGLMIGLAVALSFSDVTSPMLRSSDFDRSLWGIFFSNTLPLFLTYLFIKLKWRIALYIHLFLNALIYGFSLFSVALSFRHTLWFAYFSVLLSQSCYCMLMFFLCLLASSNTITYKGVFAISVYAFMIICFLHQIVP